MKIRDILVVTVITITSMVLTQGCGMKVVNQSQIEKDIQASYQKGYQTGRTFSLRNLKKPKVVVRPMKRNPFPKGPLKIEKATLKLTDDEIQFVKDMYQENLVLQRKYSPELSKAITESRIK